MTLQTAEKTSTLWVGAQNSDSAYYVHVAATAVGRLVDSARDSLILAPAEPAGQQDDPGS